MKLRSAALLVAMMAICTRAFAHGPVPAATELLVRDDAGASLVRLTPGGFAHRVPDGFRFICPEASGTNVLAPAAAISTGPVIVASDALYVLELDGGVTAHPVQSGSGKVIAGQRDAVFVVFENLGRYELRRVTRTTNELLQTLAGPVDSMSANEEELALLRYEDSSVEVERLSLQGVSRSVVTWTTPNVIADAKLRSTDTELYAVVWGDSAPWVTLGRVGPIHYEPLREGGVDIAGPAGALLAIDGTLALMDGGTAFEARGDRVTCLGVARDEAYACVGGNLRNVEGTGLATELFDIARLQAPDLSFLDDTRRAACTTRWLDLGVDIAASLPTVANVDAGAGPSDAAVVPANDAAAHDDGVAHGCSAAGGDPSWLAIALTLARLRRRRS